MGDLGITFSEVTSAQREAILFSLVESTDDREALREALDHVASDKRARVVEVLRSARWRSDVLAATARINTPMRKRYAKALRQFQTDVKQARRGLAALIALHGKVRVSAEH